MEPINLRLQEYRLALLIFRAGCLLAFNRQTNTADRPKLIFDIFEYCYYRYITFDIRVAVNKRNEYALMSRQAKERIIVYLQRNRPDATHRICNKIFGVHNWTYVLPLEYRGYETN